MNIKTISILFLIIVFFASCDSVKKPNKPDVLLSKIKMADILTDMSVVTSAKGINRKMIIDSIGSSEKHIYNKHGVDSLQFAQSSEYYSYYLKDYEAIYTDVNARLVKLKTEYKVIDEKEKADKKIADSLKRIRKDSLATKLKLGKGKLKRTLDTLR